MFGFVFGALCLGGLFAVLGGARHGHHHHHCGGHGWRGGHRWRRGRGFGRSALYTAFEHLDATPGQEKVIQAVLDELKDDTASLREKLTATRQSVAAAFRAEHLDEAALESLVAQHTSDMASFGARVIGALGKVHEALDPDQRRHLARLIESGPFGFRGARC